MTVITIRGQFGSGAPEIGKLIARKLRIGYVDREIIEQVARMLDRREPDVIAKEMPAGSLLGRIGEALGHTYPAAPTGGYVNLPVYLPVESLPLDNARYLKALKSIITELATSEAIVIRGRGSHLILKNWPGAFHVLFVSPHNVRVRRVMVDMKVDEESARKTIESFDGSRRRFIRQYFNAELEDPAHYDMVINTENLSFESAASIIIAAAPLKQRND